MDHGRLLARSRLIFLVYSLFSPYRKYEGTGSEHMTSKREYSTGRSQIFLAVIFFGSCRSPPQLIQPQWLPLSFSLTHRAGTCLPLLASKGNRGGSNHTTAKQMWFSYLLLFHAYMQSHSFSISNLVLAVPSTEIHEWITDLYTSKHFT
jgi:hypothetical protein